MNSTPRPPAPAHPVAASAKQRLPEPRLRRSSRTWLAEPGTPSDILISDPHIPALALRLLEGFKVPSFGGGSVFAKWNPVFIGAMAWLIIAVSLLACALMWLLIERIDAIRVASLFYFGPPVTMLMAWAAFGDRLLTTDIIGLGVIATGVVLNQTNANTGVKLACTLRLQS